MSKTIEQIEKELDEKIPRSVISERDGGGGRRLSYLEGHYVIDRLNKVFGHLNWNKEITEITSLGTPKPSYLVKIRLTIETTKGSIIKEGVGYGSDKSSNNPHELAIKEAVTDALKVAAKDLGMSMGLALYDRSQENVEEDDERKETPVPTKQESKSSVGTQEPASIQKIEETIRSYVRIADKQKRLSSEQFKERLKTEYKVAKLAELSSGQMQAELAYLQTLTK